MLRPLACLALLLIACPGRADGFANELMYRGDTLAGWLRKIAVGERADRLAASRVLLDVGPEAHEAAPALLMALKNDDAVIRGRVADALARIGPRAVPLLTAALTFDEEQFCEGAARALRRAGPPAKDALRALDHALRRWADTQAGAECLQALWAVSERPVRMDVAARMVQAGLLLRNAPELLPRFGRDALPVVPALVDQLAAAEPRREAARRALLALGPVAVPALIEALKDGSAREVLEAADLLGRFTPPAVTAVPALVPVLHKGSVAAQVAAARALGRIGVSSPEVLAGLRQGLRDPSPDLRAESAQALAAFGERAVAALPELLKARADENDTVMAAARAALARTGKAAVPGLIEALKGPDDLARGQAMKTLRDIGPTASEAAGPLATIAAERRLFLSADAVAALAAIGAVESLGKLAWDGKELNETAATALGRMGPAAAPARERLVRALPATGPKQREVVIEALGRIGAALDAADLIDNAKEPALRRVLIEALGRAGVKTKEARPVLVAALKDGPAAAREAALTFIERAGPDDAPLDELVPLLDGQLYRRAAEVLLAAGKGDVLLARWQEQRKKKKRPFTPDDLELIAWLGPKARPLSDDLRGMNGLTEPGRMARAYRALGLIDPGDAAVPKALVKVLGTVRGAEEPWVYRALMTNPAWAREAVPALLPLLERRQSLTRRLLAAETIGAYGAEGAKAAALLVELLGDLDAEAERAAQAVADLIALGQEADLAVHASVLIDAESQHHLKEAIDAARGRVPGAAALVRRALLVARDDHRERIESALRALGPAGEEAAREGLRIGNAATRAAAARFLSPVAIGGPNYGELRGGTRDPSPLVALASARALSARDVILRHLDAEPAAALEALAEVRPINPGLVPVIVPLLNRPEREVRAAAAKVLRLMKAEVALPPGPPASGRSPSERIEGASGEELAALLGQPLRRSLRLRAVRALKGRKEWALAVERLVRSAGVGPEVAAAARE